jgi:hypothetical protein
MNRTQIIPPSPASNGQVQPASEPDATAIPSAPPPPGTPASTLAAPTGPAELAPVPLLASRRKVDLATVEMSNLAVATPVEQLVVREMKGIGQTFTPNLAGALTFRGLVYKPAGEYEEVHQIIAGPLLLKPLIASRLKMTTFVPTFSWSTLEVVLAPFKMTKFGMRVLQALQSLQSEFPDLKVFYEWESSKKRHVVQSLPMTAQERELIAKVIWPSKDQIIEALQITAFDNIDVLAAANEEIRTLLSARMVE